MHKRTRQHAGFTLVELLTAVSILGLMLFLINELFQSTSIAVSTSVQQSKAIAATRIVGEQLNEDFDAIQPPRPAGGAGGYIVIFNNKLQNVPMRNPRNLSEVVVPEMRSDQIVFIRDAAGLRSMTPRNRQSFGSDLTATSGQFAKVWYGHVERTDSEGRQRGNSTAERLGGVNAGFDRIGSDFILGRQAMLFNPDGLVATDIYARDARWGVPVENSGYTLETPATYLGLTDVTIQDYTRNTPGNALLNRVTTGNVAAQNGWYTNTAFPSRRPRVNPNPTGTNYQSWAIAQTHPILAPGCSEFVVQFAADLDGNGRIDTTGNNNDLGGSIIWYDGYNIGNRSWYRDSSTKPQPRVAVTGPNIDHAFVFRVDDDGVHPDPGNDPGVAENHSDWPYLIRIRYRLHDTRGRLMGNYPTALVDGIDNDGDGEIDESDEDQIAGQWYEHIIRVPRP